MRISLIYSHASLLPRMARWCLMIMAAQEQHLRRDAIITLPKRAFTSETAQWVLPQYYLIYVIDDFLWYIYYFSSWYFIRFAPFASTSFMQSAMVTFIAYLPRASSLRVCIFISIMHIAFGRAIVKSAIMHEKRHYRAPPCRRRMQWW